MSLDRHDPADGPKSLGISEPASTDSRTSFDTGQQVSPLSAASFSADAMRDEFLERRYKAGTQINFASLSSAGALSFLCKSQQSDRFYQVEPGTSIPGGVRNNARAFCSTVVAEYVRVSVGVRMLPLTSNCPKSVSNLSI